MPVEFVPTVPVALSLAACGLLPLVLLTLSHGRSRVAAPGRRFVVATVVTWAAWLAAMIATAPEWVDLVSGVLLLATATLAGLTLWTLVAWGFTVSMLLALERAGRPSSVDEWALAATRGRSLEVFARDRLGVLLALGLAQVQGERVVMTPLRGQFVARTARALRLLFGITR
jgi:hypothetical protein